MMYYRPPNPGRAIFPQLRLGVIGRYGISHDLITSSRPDTSPVAWAEAEIVLASMLAQGYHPIHLEREVEVELMQNVRPSYRREFFLECQRILTNSREANLFIGLPSLGEYEELSAVRDGRLGFELMMYRRFSGPSVLSRSMMMDSEFERELGRSQALNREIEAELRNVREREIRAQTERYQVNEASLRELQVELAEARFRAETAEAKLEINSGRRSNSGATDFTGASSAHTARFIAPVPQRLEPRSQPPRHGVDNAQNYVGGSYNPVGVQGQEFVQHSPSRPVRVEVDLRSITSARSSRGRGEEEVLYAPTHQESAGSIYPVEYAASILPHPQSRGLSNRSNVEPRSGYSTPPRARRNDAISRPSRPEHGNSPTYQVRTRSEPSRAYIPRGRDLVGSSGSYFIAEAISGVPTYNAEHYRQAPSLPVSNRGSSPAKTMDSARRVGHISISGSTTTVASARYSVSGRRRRRDGRN